MESYWNLNLEPTENPEAIVSLIKGQAELLSKETDGRVLGVFIKKRTSPFFELQTLSKDISTVRHGKNAAELYHKQTYEFYICDKFKQYELAVFDLVLNAEYPINIKIDESIAEEAKKGTEIEIASYSEFDNLFYDIVNTHMVKYVIRRLCKIVENKETESAIGENSSNTVPDQQ